MYCGEGETPQTKITGVWEQGSQCLGHTGFVPIHDVCVFLVYTAQAPGCSAGELSKAGPGLRALPRPKLHGFRFLGTPQGTDSVAPAFCALPRSKQLRPPDQVLGKCTLPLGGTYYHLPSPSPSASWVCRVSPLGSWSLTATLMADVNHPGSQQDLVSNWELAHRLVEDAVSGAKIAPCLPALTVSRLPLCSSGGRGRSGAGRLSSTI